MIRVVTIVAAAVALGVSAPLASAGTKSKKLDKASPVLMKHCLIGSHFAARSAEI
jgi:hypothetical protein